MSLGLLADALAVSVHVGWLAMFAMSGIASKCDSNQQQKFDIHSKVVCWHSHSHRDSSIWVLQAFAIVNFLLRVNHSDLPARPQVRIPVKPLFTSC